MHRGRLSLSNSYLDTVEQILAAAFVASDYDEHARHTCGAVSVRAAAILTGGDGIAREKRAHQPADDSISMAKVRQQF
jgi:hypothetical protein